MVSVPSDHTGAVAAGFPTDRRWQAAARHAAAPANFVADVVAAAAASVSSVAMSIHEATMSMVDARSEDEQVQHGAAGPGAGRLVE